MRIPFIISISLHVSVVLVAWLGLPYFASDHLEIPTRSIEVDLVSEEDIIKKVAQADASPPPKPKPKPTPKPIPDPEPELEPTAEAVPVAPKKVEKKPETKKPEVKTVPSKPQQLVQQPRPQSKPKEPPKMNMASVLKTVAALEDAPMKKKIEKEKDLPKEKLSLQDAVAKALKTKQTEKQTATFDGQLSMREMDAVKRQIAGCWNIQAGARDAENLRVKLKVLMNPDMTVRSVQEIDTGESSNPFWQAASEGARRAVLKCSPLQLPMGKYDIWKVINFTFDPKQMFG